MMRGESSLGKKRGWFRSNTVHQVDLLPLPATFVCAETGVGIEAPRLCAVFIVFLLLRFFKKGRLVDELGNCD